MDESRAANGEGLLSRGFMNERLQNSLPPARCSRISASLHHTQPLYPYHPASFMKFYEWAARRSGWGSTPTNCGSAVDQWADSGREWRRWTNIPRSRPNSAASTSGREIFTVLYHTEHTGVMHHGLEGVFLLEIISGDVHWREISRFWWWKRLRLRIIWYSFQFVQKQEDELSKFVSILGHC